MANEAPNEGLNGAKSWLATQIQGLRGVDVSVADMAVADRPELSALRFGTPAASCLLIDDLDMIRETLFEALHQCNELQVRRHQAGG
jgi:hypothetical protein